ncbi:MAG: hypothetical protein IPL63_15710 [Saprospiraceae bacterium]|nr:hypothetical protein [Saprospiraceae bacterium]
MRIIVFTCFVLGLINNLHGQISINSSSFPTVGTVLKGFTIDNPSGISQGQKGENKVWNFNNISGGTPFVEKYVNPSEGQYAASFPDANLLVKSNRQEENEIYAKSLSSRIELVGFGGENPVLGGEIALPYTKRPQLRRSPMYYETSSFSEGLFGFSLSADSLPDSLFEGAPFQVDSIRISNKTLQYDTIDAWGKVNLKNKEFDVLREKSTVISSVKVEIKVPILGWLDLETLFGGAGFPGIGSDTTIVYKYFTNTRKDILVSISTTSDNEVIQVEYADVDNTISTSDFSVNENNRISPNPVHDRFFFKNQSLQAGNYTVKILTIDGKMVNENKRYISKDESLMIETGTLVEGLYFLILYPEKGNQIIRSPFVVKH